MKQKLFLMVMILGMCSINASAQTKKWTTDKKKNSVVEVTKSREVGRDGYIWYKLKKGKLYGAQNIEGKIVIPVRYSMVDYRCDDRYGSHWFCVGDGDFEGAYTIEGDYVVTTDKHYVDVILFGKNGRFAWVVKTNQGAWGLLDVKGNIVVSPQFSGGYSGNVPTIGCALGENCILVTHKNMEGACDLNGKLIIEPKYSSCFFSGNCFKVKTSESSSFQDINIDLPSSIRYDYVPFGGMYFDFKERPYIRVSSSGSSSNSSSSPGSSSSSNLSGNSNSGNNTTTVVVEHHRDPVPVQEWQSCTNCWGEGKVMCLGACGGTGTYYVGDRLRICSSCNGSGKKICPYCSGQGGKYYTVYK